MADMYDTSCSSPPPPSLLESDEISLFLHHLLHSSSSSSMFDKAKHVQSFALPPPPPPPPPMFSTSTAEYCHVKTPPEDLHRPCRSTGLFDLDCRVRDGTSTAESSAAVDSSSALICSSSGVYFPADVKYSSGNTSSYFRTADSDAITAPVERMKFPADNDLDVYDCESEEGLEASEGPSEPIPPRASSKRSRAAEVHNLSEKRRRSRINEKMKALQNLIPNSNKFLPAIVANVDQSLITLFAALFGLHDVINEKWVKSASYVLTWSTAAYPTASSANGLSMELLSKQSYAVDLDHFDGYCICHEPNHMLIEHSVDLFLMVSYFEKVAE
ncbi:hypothetical protein HHK36_009895 [Tetracentron sinense]|uniref:BHLH domain-containing protein n=1 Tax=Tetracentron sinense TaxID=13715 RepID=A0A834ZG03_TETSI|nr:hypothetical protein HHK36_009895 [Tetracentron sinense]